MTEMTPPPHDNTNPLHKAQLLRCAHAFRLGQEALAASLWQDIISALAANHGLMANSDFIALLPQMLAAQERKDWLGLADNIEYELLDICQQLHSEGNHR